jgi:trans-aconitate methyltransferase
MHLIDNKIAVAVHTYGHIDPTIYNNHIGVFSEWAKTYNIVFMGLDGAKVAQARNILVENALKMNCSHILFIDADHIIHSSMLPYLLGNTDAAAVSGLVVKTSEPHEQVGFVNCDETGMSNGVCLPLDDKSYDVDACAFGCTLIDLSVFQNIKKPYFKDKIVEGSDGTLYQRRSDLVFCEELKKLGKIIRIDTRVQIGHMGKKQVFYPVDTYNTTMNKKLQIPVYEEARRVLQKGSFSRVVDIGCGNGSKLEEYIYKLCPSILGFDFDPARLDICKACMPRGTWVKTDLSKPLDYSLESTDLVICADVLEHLENPLLILDSIPSGATCIFSTPDVDSIESSVKSNPDHKQFWTKESFQRLIESSGFKVKTLEHYQEVLDYKGIIVVCIKQ